MRASASHRKRTFWAGGTLSALPGSTKPASPAWAARSSSVTGWTEAYVMKQMAPGAPIAAALAERMCDIVNRWPRAIDSRFTAR